MTPEQWSHVSEVFATVLEHPVHEREARAQHLCGGDTHALKEVMALLEADAAATGFLDLPVLESQDFTLPTVGTRVGSYRLLAKLGQGGMGVVFRAERADGQFRKNTAIKFLLQRPDSTLQVQRLQQERQILANLEHPNIARLLDGGTTEDGLPFLVMEEVHGEPLGDYCEKNRVPIKDRLEILLRICDAVQHAHQQMILHRDLKPSNILVTEAGEPKLLDFGIARLLLNEGPESKEAPRAIPFLTRAYASPELLSGDPASTASDVYSLGIILGQLLTPWPRGKFGLRGDLETIRARAVAPDPKHRYRTARELALDLRHALEKRPLTTRRNDRLYQLGCFLRRNVAASALGLLLAFLAIWSASTFARQNLRLVEERDAAVEAQEEAEQLGGLLKDIFQVSNPFETPAATVGNTEELTARDLLERGAQKLRSEPGLKPGVRAEVLAMIGNVYRSLGLDAEAEALLGEALELRENAGVETAKLTQSLLDLAQLRDLAGHPEEASALVKRAMVLLRKEHPPNVQQLAAGLTAEGEIQRNLGHFEKAKSSHQEALNLRLGWCGLRCEPARESLSNLAIVLLNLGEPERAERLLRLSLVSNGNTSAPTLVRSIQQSNLALALQHQGKMEEAEAFLSASLDLRRELLAPGHPSLVMALNNLATFLLRQGQPGAVALLEEAIATGSESLGENNPTIAMCRYNLASHFIDAKQYSKAESMYQEGLENFRQALGDQHPAVLVGHHQLGIIALREGKARLAESRFRSAAEGRGKALGLDHPKTMSSLLALAKALMSLGRFSEAEEMSRKAEVILAKAGTGSRLQVRAASILGDSLVHQNRKREAEEAFLRAKKVLDDTPETTRSEHSAVLKALLALYAKWPEKRLEHQRYQQRLATFTDEAEKKTTN